MYIISSQTLHACHESSPYCSNIVIDYKEVTLKLVLYDHHIVQRLGLIMKKVVIA